LFTSLDALADRAWCAYILRCGDGSFYVGSTCRLRERVAEHQAGRGARYTRWKQPVVLAAWFACQSRREAQQLEARLKRLNHSQKEMLVSQKLSLCQGDGGQAAQQPSPEGIA